MDYDGVGPTAAEREVRCHRRQLHRQLQISHRLTEEELLHVRRDDHVIYLVHVFFFYKQSKIDKKSTFGK